LHMMKKDLNISKQPKLVGNFSRRLLVASRDESEKPTLKILGETFNNQNTYEL